MRAVWSNRVLAQSIDPSLMCSGIVGQFGDGEIEIDASFLRETLCGENGPILAPCNIIVLMARENSSVMVSKSLLVMVSTFIDDLPATVLGTALELLMLEPFLMSASGFGSKLCEPDFESLTASGMASAASGSGSTSCRPLIEVMSSMEAL